MKEIIDKNFGLLNSLWLPDSILLWGLSYSNPEVASHTFSEMEKLFDISPIAWCGTIKRSE